MKLPSDERIKWMVENVSDRNKNGLIEELLMATKKASERHGDETLANLLDDWEATIEVDSNPELARILLEAESGEYVELTSDELG